MEEMKRKKGKNKQTNKQTRFFLELCRVPNWLGPGTSPAFDPQDRSCQRGTAGKKDEDEDEEDEDEKNNFFFLFLFFSFLLIFEQNQNGSANSRSEILERSQ